MGNARKAALLAMEKCRRAGAWSDAVLGSVLDQERLEGRDRALASALCYGETQNRLLLDHVIASCASMPLKKIEPKVLDILRLSVYQIMFMDRVPDSAAVNEAVRLCRECGFSRAAGFVNAVLRRVSGKGVDIPSGNDAEALSLRFSHPLPLTEYFISVLGKEETAALLACHNAEAPMTLQVNTLRTDTGELFRALEAAGKSVELHPFLPDCILLSGGGNPAAFPGYAEGAFYVQDAAAKLAVIAAEAEKAARIIDVCAAPGGKSFAAAIRSGGAAQILSCDLHENKLKRIREGAARLGLEKISTRAMDARSFEPSFEEQFDLVIADVPCSGLGVIRKKPDIRYKDPVDFADLPGIQSDILRNVSRYVAPGGTLLYSTCTVRTEENGDVVRAFLGEHEGFSPVPFEIPGCMSDPDGMLQLWPHRNQTDGFFIAKMRKNK